MGRGGVQGNTKLRAPFQSVDCKHPGNLGGKMSVYQDSKKCKLSQDIFHLSEFSK